jgi:hypothetical protein
MVAPRDPLEASASVVEELRVSFPAAVAAAVATSAVVAEVLTRIAVVLTRVVAEVALASPMLLSPRESSTIQG